MQVKGRPIGSWGAGGRSVAPDRSRGLLLPTSRRVLFESGRNGLYHAMPGKILKRKETAGSVELNTSSATAVTMSGEDVRDADAFGAYDSGNPKRFKATVDGRYLVTYCLVGTNQGTAAATIRAYVAKNGGSEEAGSHTCYQTAASGSTRYTVNGSFVIDLVANDYLELFTIRVTGTGSVLSVANASTFTMTPLWFKDDSIGGLKRFEACESIERVVVGKGKSGASGNTTLRCFKNGTTIMSSDLSIAYSVNSAVFDQSQFSSISFVPGDEMTWRVTGEESPAARDISVEVWMRPDA